MDSDRGILSFQDVQWRTINGMVGLLEIQDGEIDYEFLEDLKSVCTDVINARVIGEYTGFTLYQKNTMPSEDLQGLKQDYTIVLSYMHKMDKAPLTEDELKDVIRITEKITKDLKHSRDAINYPYYRKTMVLT